MKRAVLPAGKQRDMLLMRGHRQLTDTHVYLSRLPIQMLVRSSGSHMHHEIHMRNESPAAIANVICWSPNDAAAAAHRSWSSQ